MNDLFSCRALAGCFGLLKTKSVPKIKTREKKAGTCMVRLLKLPHLAEVGRQGP